jgi:hypothetical protein
VVVRQGYLNRSYFRALEFAEVGCGRRTVTDKDVAWWVPVNRRAPPIRADGNRTRDSLGVFFTLVLLIGPSVRLAYARGCRFSSVSPTFAPRIRLSWRDSTGNSHSSHRLAREASGASLHHPSERGAVSRAPLNLTHQLEDLSHREARLFAPLPAKTLQAGVSRPGESPSLKVGPATVKSAE